jgi:2-amino-4-hydroxy-6-hydroxymethyldihydropteridine diphosphokinase
VATAYIALGANLGDRLATLQAAVAELRALGTDVAASSVYETEPVGYLDQPPFLNAVVRLDTELSPIELLNQLHRIENAHARVRSFKNAPRTLDLDLLLYDQRIIDAPDLTVPHPRMADRAFVLVPLAEIAPDVIHSASGKTIRELSNAIGSTADVLRVGPLNGPADGATISLSS